MAKKKKSTNYAKYAAKYNEDVGKHHARMGAAYKKIGDKKLAKKSYTKAAQHKKASVQMKKATRGK